MPHLIPASEIERLASLAGMHDYAEWNRQLEGANERIGALLQGSIGEAWQRCIPIWMELGRVKDLSHGVRAPKYWPHFANYLGHAFAEVFCDEPSFLLSLLHESPIDSYEYLCAFDLLEMFLACGDSWLPLPEQICSLALPLPPVVQVEIQYEDELNSAKTIGDFIQLIFKVDFE